MKVDSGSENAKENIMASKIDELKAQLEQLPNDQLSEIFRWLSEKDWERWDAELADDARTGKLDFLIREAREAKATGKLKDL
jgi:hypothetical protein